MESVGIMILLFILGATLGSFGCCQAWRIYKKDKSKWSHCMKCKYRLRWYDNIPIISWLTLGGKCRKCRKPIGWAEFLAEVGLAVVFVLSFALWPARDKLMAMEFSEVLKFGLFLANTVLWLIMFVYDVKWKELPVLLMYAAIGVSVLYLGVLALMLENFWLALFTLFTANIIGSIASLPILAKKKDTKTAVPFGPFLVLGFLVVFFLQAQILSLVII